MKNYYNVPRLPGEDWNGDAPAKGKPALGRQQTEIVKMINQAKLDAEDKQVERMALMKERYYRREAERAKAEKLKVPLLVQARGRIMKVLNDLGKISDQVIKTLSW